VVPPRGAGAAHPPALRQPSRSVRHRRLPALPDPAEGHPAGHPQLHGSRFPARGRRGPELDIDFVVHGTDGIAAPWAAAAEPGDEIAFIDQGGGWKGRGDGAVLLVGDESALPAIAGVLRDLPRIATGTAIIELFDPADRQPLEGPDGVDVLWVTRDADEPPGAAALPALHTLASIPADVTAFAAGESAVATGARRHLVADRGIPKSQVTFCGYWKVGKAAG
jgi:NADPH-dependent ferric siderophore reductase